MKVVINQREYAWGDVRVFLFGQVCLGIRSIEYKKSKNKDYVRGAGRTPRGIQHGEYSCEGTIGILQSELEALNRTAQANGYDSILDVDFDILVSYGTDNLVISIDKICTASIKEMPMGIKGEDLYAQIDLPFIALDIQTNVVA